MSLPCRNPALSIRIPSSITYLYLHIRARPRRTFSTSTARLSSTTEPKNLNPDPTDYHRAPFTDKCSLTIRAGSGGHGCVSFLREKYVYDGPANGGNGGTGGNIFIQAIEGQTSLHKLARNRILKAGNGKHGQGKSKGGVRGEDVLITVPVGTVIREVSRVDPVEEATLQYRFLIGKHGKTHGPKAFAAERSRWVTYPGAQPSDFFNMDMPALPPPRRSSIAAMEPPAPFYIDLSKPMDKPMLLLSGAVGGLGNPSFITTTNPKPMFATRGEGGTSVELELELKMLADVGLVGLPNAGKSTLLRSLTNSRTRIGNWAFTTLSPNIGTYVIDSQKGRPEIESKLKKQRFTIADIPGLIEDAHLDKGLGLGFLRHVERAGVLAFVIDLSAGDAVTALQGLWRELGKYQKMREQQINLETENRLYSSWAGLREMNALNEDPDYPTSETDLVEEDSGEVIRPPGLESDPTNGMLEPTLPPMYSKPWLVIGTKADIEGTQENFKALRDYLQAVENEEAPHPSGEDNAWRGKLYSVPVSAMNAQGVKTIPEKIVRLLEGIYM
ncbi:GTP-binding protein [Ascosphaera apis ARSEF 7405]|uniref:GTP-binding protein n=1 Tax=Ascosphaera apis ARSEF 7405 TaxID=392613 RepID=A0A168B1I6_9EURO|nr:GTP-binding protein [Ascosphaera apis ARSEF 7405]